MDFKELINKYYNNTIIEKNEKSSFKYSVYNNGYNHSYRFRAFARLIRNKEEFLAKLFERIEKFRYLCDDTIKGQDFKFSIDCVMLAANYLSNHNLEQDIWTFIFACTIVIEFNSGIFALCNVLGRKTFTVSIYDIFRYYLIYITIDLLNLSTDNIDVSQDKSNYIEFANVDIRLPYINGRSLQSEFVCKIIKFTNFKNYLSETELKKVDYRLSVNCNNQEFYILPTFEIIEKYIEYLELSYGNFIILEGSDLVDNFIFIQSTACFTENYVFDNTYCVQAQRKEMINHKEILRQYELEVKKEELLKIFKSFIQGISPTIENWELIDEIDL